MDAYSNLYVRQELYDDGGITYKNEALVGIYTNNGKQRLKIDTNLGY